MNLKAKLVAALAGTSSRNPVNTETLAIGHTMRNVKAELAGMAERREVMCCNSIKPGQKPVFLWWLPGNVDVKTNHMKTAKAKKAEMEE